MENIELYKHLIKKRINALYGNEGGQPITLRRIEALTDDEKQMLYNIIHCSIARMAVQEYKYSFKVDAVVISDEYGASVREYNKLCYDYLTQIGIALHHFIILPNGETFTASVKWQIENNIIKI